MPGSCSATMAARLSFSWAALAHVCHTTDFPNRSTPAPSAAATTATTIATRFHREPVVEGTVVSGVVVAMALRPPRFGGSHRNTAN